MLIDRQTLCRTDQMQVERMGDEIQHLAIREPPDSNPTLPFQSQVKNASIINSIPHPTKDFPVGYESLTW